jgi:adenine-specific DNA-methyltransferase
MNLPTSLKLVKVFKKYGELVEEKFNMLIFGDNLQAMKMLIENPEIRGKVRLIYIDPPFATGQNFRYGNERVSHISSSNEDEIAYVDKFTRTEYLKFLRDRLVLMREILADDGSIYIHTDCKIGHYVKVLMDEIFGEEHFINDITRIKCNPKNFERKGYGNIKDMILFYSKTNKYVWNGSLQEYTREQIKRLFPKVDKDGRRYTTNPLHAPGETKNGATGQPWRGILPPKGRHWRYPPEVLEELDRKGLIEWSKTGNPRKKIYADEFIKKKTKRQDVWEFKDPPYPSYPTEKNLDMLKVIIEASSNPGDIVMDSFCGSGTTLEAAEELGRRWIGIDNSPIAIEVALKRLLSLKNYRAFALYNTSDEPLSDTIQKLL